MVAPGLPTMITAGTTTGHATDSVKVHRILNKFDLDAIDVALPAGQALAVTGGLLAPRALAKADVGLANVDNTSDAAKPVSTAQQTALDAKVTGTSAGAADGQTLIYVTASARFEPGNIGADDIATGQLGIDRLPPGATIVVDYSKAVYGAANAWPASRPTSRTDLVVIWLYGTGAPDPGSIAIAGDILDATAA